MRTLPSENAASETCAQQLRHRPAGNDRAPGKLDLLDQYLATPADSNPLRAACQLGKVKPCHAVAVLRVLVTASRQGRCDQSVAQVAAKLWLPEPTVRRALQALTSAGLLVTVQKGRSPGRAGKGQPGRAAVRRITLLDQLAAAAPDAEMTAHSGRNDRAPECAPLRVRSTEKPPRGKTRNAPPLTLTGRGGNEQQTGQRSWSRAEQELASKAAQHLCEQQGSSVRSQQGWTQHKRAQVLAKLAELQGAPVVAVADRWQRAAQVTEPRGASAAVTLLAAITEGQVYSPFTVDALDEAITAHQAKQAAQPA